MTLNIQDTNTRLVIALHAATWLVIMMVYLYLFSTFFSIELSLLRGLVNVLPMMVLFYFNWWLVNRLLEQKRYISYFLAAGAVLLLMVFVRVQFNLLFPEVNRDMFLATEQEGWRIGALITNLCVLVVSTFYQILQNRYKVETRNREVINQQKEAQLQFLRAQINPHFLFNTLNNIYSLAVVKSDKTAGMVLKLSNLLRYVIYDGKAEQVALHREVAQIKEYIELFRMRSEELLDIRMAVEGSLEGITLEPMILIPIVENCFKHCDFELNEHAFVRINLRLEKGQLYFTTINSRNKEDRQKDKIGGVGLDNIQKRLDLKYPNAYDLKIEPKPETFTVELSILLKR